MEVCYDPIGIVHTDFRDPRATPIQGMYSHAKGTIEIYPGYEEGLTDLDGFSHLFLIYHFHRAGSPRLLVRPFLDHRERGIFATRHHDRPNPIGLSIVQLVSIEGNALLVRDIDILDGTPLLDIKPYVRQFDIREDIRCGWIDKTSSEPGEGREFTPRGLERADHDREAG